jgi:diaminohydroxyphosphoribosylaminopyrimidine deaminase / 5-amino-6-(5-phosphoribosylamino)uracil reductase
MSLSENIKTIRRVPMASRTDIESLCGSYVEAAKKFLQDDTRTRPFVILSFAQSLDGCIAKVTGGTRNVSSSETLELRHRLRSLNDGLLVGRGTIASDNPILNVRFVDGPSPQPIILDTRLQTNLESRVIKEGENKPWFVFGETVHPDLTCSFIGEGCDLIRVRPDEAGLSITETLEQLHSRGIKTLMVEGGASVIQSFLSEGLADFVMINISSQFISEPGSQKYSIHSHGRAPRIDEMSTFTLENEIITYGSMSFHEPIDPVPQTSMSIPQNVHDLPDLTV